MKINYKSIKVEPGFPIPPLETRDININLNQMGVGDSFAFDLVEFGNVTAAVEAFEVQDTGKDNREYLVDVDKLRVWRLK